MKNVLKELLPLYLEICNWYMRPGDFTCIQKTCGKSGSVGIHEPLAHWDLIKLDVIIYL